MGNEHTEGLSMSKGHTGRDYEFGKRRNECKQKNKEKNGPNCSEGWASDRCDSRTQSPTEYTFLHA
jgi:hypothetical protein